MSTGALRPREWVLLGATAAASWAVKKRWDDCAEADRRNREAIDAARADAEAARASHPEIPPVYTERPRFLGAGLQVTQPVFEDDLPIGARDATRVAPGAEVTPLRDITTRMPPRRVIPQDVLDEIDLQVAEGTHTGSLPGIQPASRNHTSRFWTCTCNRDHCGSTTDDGVPKGVRNDARENLSGTAVRDYGHLLQNVADTGWSCGRTPLDDAVEGLNAVGGSLGSIGVS
jgi:hypothetical protein